MSLNHTEVNIMNSASQNAETVARWREGAGQDNPAGPLFGGNDFAESDITAESIIRTFGACGTACTGSYTRYCC